MDVAECKLHSEKKFSEVAVKIQHIEDEVAALSESLTKQSDMVKDIQQLSTSVSILANNMKSMLEEQQKQSERLQTLESKPAKRWDAIIDKIIMLVVAALVGALLIKLGIG